MGSASAMRTEGFIVPLPADASTAINPVHKLTLRQIAPLPLSSSSNSSISRGGLEGVALPAVSSQGPAAVQLSTERKETLKQSYAYAAGSSSRGVTDAAGVHATGLGKSSFSPSSLWVASSSDGNGKGMYGLGSSSSSLSLSGPAVAYTFTPLYRMPYRNTPPPAGVPAVPAKLPLPASVAGSSAGRIVKTRQQSSSNSSSSFSGANPLKPAEAGRPAISLTAAPTAVFFSSSDPLHAGSTSSSSPSSALPSPSEPGKGSRRKSSAKGASSRRGSKKQQWEAVPQLNSGGSSKSGPAAAGPAVSVAALCQHALPFLAFVISTLADCLPGGCGRRRQSNSLNSMSKAADPSSSFAASSPLGKGKARGRATGNAAILAPSAALPALKGAAGGNAAAVAAAAAPVAPLRDSKKQPAHLATAPNPAAAAAAGLGKASPAASVLSKQSSLSQRKQQPQRIGGASQGSSGRVIALKA